MTFPTAPGLRRRAATVGLLLSTAGCSGLLPKAAAPPAFYALDGSDASAAASPPRETAQRPRVGGRTLIVSPLTAAPGYDSPRIVYLRQPHQLAHYAQSEWVDTPARMLAPQVVAALAASGAFAAVVMAPSGAVGELRLDLALLRLQHDFSTGPRSQVRLSLRATLVDTTTRRVLEQRVFDEQVETSRDDAYGGVLAANQAVAQALRALTAMCAEAAGP